jgi:hypothetical protein
MTLIDAAGSLASILFLMASMVFCVSAKTWGDFIAGLFIGIFGAVGYIVWATTS